MKKNILIAVTGLYALVALEDYEDDNGNVMERAYLSNFADAVNRYAPEVWTQDLPADATLIETTAEFTTHSVITPFGPLSASDAYVLVPVSTMETSILPNMQFATNWIVLPLATGDSISIEGSLFTVKQAAFGTTSFDVEDNDSCDDCLMIDIPPADNKLEDMTFTVVNDDFEAIASFGPEDPEYRALTFTAGAPNLRYDLQPVSITDENRALLEGLGTPAAIALLKAEEAEAADMGRDDFTIMLSKPAPVPTSALPIAA